MSPVLSKQTHRHNEWLIENSKVGQVNLPTLLVGYAPQTPFQIRGFFSLLQVGFDTDRVSSLFYEKLIKSRFYPHF